MNEIQVTYLNKCQKFVISIEFFTIERKIRLKYLIEYFKFERYASV